MSEATPERWTVLALLNWTTGYFQRVGVSARLAAEVLLSHVLGCRRIELYARHADEPTAEHRDAFRELVRRAAGREPVAYLVGEKEFYSLRFRVTPDVLVPRPETEILVSEAIAHLRGRGGRRPAPLSRAAPLGGERPEEARLGGGEAADGHDAERRALPAPADAGVVDGPELTLWDACTGSGCVGIAIAANVPNVRALATDVSTAALAVARENAERLGVAERMRFTEADLLTPPAGADPAGPYDVITANPPYIADGDPVGEEVQHEPALALRGGPDGLDRLRPVIREAPGLLKPGGALVVEFGYQQADDVRDLLVATEAFGEPKILRDLNGIERAAVAVRKA